MKTLTFAALGVLVGMVAGAVGMHQWFMPQLMEMDQMLQAKERQIRGLAGVGDDSARLARLEAERKTYEANLEELREELKALRSQAPMPEPAPEDAPADADPGDRAETQPGTDAGGEAGEEDRRRWGRDSTPEEREARRQEFVARLQDNLTAFFTGELEKSNTPAMEERLIALETQVYDLMALRRQMREAEEGAEQDALRAAYEETMAAAEATMRDQQRDMLDAVARQFNITSAADRKAFQNAVRAAVDSPFFSDNPSALFWSAGRPSESFGRGPRRGYGR